MHLTEFHGAPRPSSDLAERPFPPPAWSLERCGVGFDGETGCRICAETCPHEAIRPLGTSAGLRIHVDQGICQRCGACTSACPSSALDRAFMRDDEIDARVADAVALHGERPVILFTHAASRALAEAVSPELPVATVELPSLLILNETHLLHALRCGARGVVLIGHPAGHHGAPRLFETPLRLARAALPPKEGARLAYVEDARGSQTLELLDGIVRSLRLPLAREADAPGDIEGNHRERFAALAAANSTRSAAAVRLEDVPFGEVAVMEPGCTLCGACTRVCPTDALDSDEVEGRLSFKGIDCIGCGLCEQACPEEVLTLTPGLVFSPEMFERQTLVKDDVIPCRTCGTPHLPKRLLEHSRTILSAASGGQAASTRQIDLCPSCRSVVALDVPVRGERKNGCGSGNCGCGGNGESRAPEPTGTSGLNRRSFLGILSVAVGGLTALAAGKAQGQALAGNGSPRKLTKRLGMVIDLERCIGCHACTAACKAENQVPLGVFRDWVEEHVMGEYPHAQPYFLPKLCNQCTDPSCLRACPTGAIYMRPDGIVDINHDICIGCRACVQACPYGVPFMDPVRGTADKCNFCTHRVDEGLNPACVDICPTSTRIFGNLNDPESPPSLALRGKPHQVLRQELGLGPNVRYLGLPAELDR
jgi:tetrathionate reductase subunit B